MQRGNRLGPYTLVRLLGAGGSGEVWEAVLAGPAGFRKPVAVKVLRSGPDSAAKRHALMREARIGALLQHPNVVATLQLGEHDGQWCIALELVHGPSVSDLVQSAGGRLPPPAVLEVGLQTCAALQHIHGFRADGTDAGLVHRDVKPGNLLVDRSGVVKLGDLGISVLSGEPGEIAGTPGYMAPEQAKGRPEPRSDLFALGATLYRIATGLRPFGSGADTRAAIREVEARLASPEFLAPVDEAVTGLGAVVRRCLRFDPAQRFGSAQEVGEALAALRPRARVGSTLLELLARSRPELGIEVVPTPPSQEATRVIPTGNLPPPRDAFVGRDAELAALAELADARWVVVVGPGGIGKTRLAVELARRSQRGVAGGAWAFDLSSARGVDSVCAAVAAALELELERRDPVGQLGRVLGAKGPALVVLDNLEQCVDALPATLGRWLTLAPDVRFVGTSRVIPGLLGERVVALGDLSPTDAEALFLDRAPRALAAEERREVGPLCAALDHNPLAIELAVARLRTLDLGAVRARLSLALLGGGSADRPDRHRSLLASLKWSWELLGPTARAALTQLAVFEGGCDLAAAEAVLDLRSAPDAPWALDVLQELADASLVRVEPRAGRFRLLVVVQEFAAQQLSADQRLAAERRHGAHFAQAGAPGAVSGLDGPEGHKRFRALMAELGNLVAACRRAVARGDVQTAVATLWATEALNARQGPPSVVFDLAAAVLALPDLPMRERAKAAWCAGLAHERNGDPAAALPHFELARAGFREVGDTRGEYNVVGKLGGFHQQQGNPAEARRYFELALAHSRAVGDRRAEGVVLSSFGLLEQEQGRWAEARACLEGAVAAHRETRNRVHEGIVLGTLGMLHQHQGHTAEARALYEAAIAIDSEVGNRRFEAMNLSNLGTLLFEQGQRDEAQRLLERAVAVHREIGNRRFEAVALANLGVLLEDAGRLDEALGHFERALAVHRDVGNKRSEGITLVGMGSVYEAQGRAIEARAAYERAVYLLRELGEQRQEGGALRYLANLSFHEGRTAEAAALLDRAEGLVQAVPSELGSVYLLRAELLLAAGDVAAARAAVEAAHAVAAWNAAVAREIERLRALLAARPS